MANFVLYRQSSNYYVRFVRFQDLMVWDDDAKALAASPTWAHSAIALTFSDDIGGHPVSIPSDLPSGEYHMLFYDAASPAKTDEIKVGKVIQVRSGVLAYPITKALDI